MRSTYIQGVVNAAMIIKIVYPMTHSGIPGNRKPGSVKTFIKLNKNLMKNLQEGLIQNLEYRETEKDKMITGIFTWEKANGKATEGLL